MKKYTTSPESNFVFFTWSLCPYCKAVEKGVEKLSNQYEILEYIVDEHGWPDKYGIKLVPCIGVFKNGKLTSKIEGALTIEQIEEFLKENK